MVGGRWRRPGVIAGRYQPIETAKPGAPFRARDAATAQTVVIHTIGDVTEVAPWLSRAAMVIGLFHPSLVTLFDGVQSDPSTLMAVCEFVPAQPLRRVMAGAPLNARRAAELVSEVADAVAELHARGFAHGAISADSVWVTAKGKAKLDLVPAIRETGASEEGDVRALVALVGEAAGRDLLHAPSVESVAVLAAHLRLLRP